MIKKNQKLLSSEPEKYFKIKECLNKCGNQVKECKKEDVIKVLHFFLNTNYNLNR